MQTYEDRGSPVPNPADGRRDRAICPLARAIDINLVAPSFNGDAFFKSTVDDRTRALRAILSEHAIFDLAESLGQLSPLEGIRLRTKTAPQEQQAAAADLRVKLLSQAGASYGSDRASQALEALLNILICYRVGACTREGAQRMSASEYFNQLDDKEFAEDCSHVNAMVERITYGSAIPEGVSIPISIFTSCCVDDGFDSGVHLLDPSQQFQDNTAKTADLTISFVELHRKLGSPNLEPWPGGKVTTQWVMHHRGHVFTIYDYKQSDESGEGALAVSAIRSDISMNWHVGAHKGVDPHLLLSALEIQS